ncbi:hypothetical protein ATK86_4068 [Nocardia fluminea]|uniref:Uncharacterized protein n=1 Tax=Nocardia fluminea TaxID=134984 RepID=A0A2N3VDE8_9NOCA|nr:hypothetical protein ATK86_4068 [Nocardia fluminea]
MVGDEWCSDLGLLRVSISYLDGLAIGAVRAAGSIVLALSDDERALLFEPGEDRLVVAYLLRDILVGPGTVNVSKDLIRLKRAIDARTSRDEVEP